MDGTLTRAALDVSGRPFLVFRAEFSRDKVGEMDTELFREFFQAFAMNAGITLHIENFYTDNNHHLAESMFKAVARALREAVEIDPRVGRSGAEHQGHALGFRRFRAGFCTRVSPNARCHPGLEPGPILRSQDGSRLKRRNDIEHVWSVR